MQFSNILAVAVLLAGSAFASPVAEANYGSPSPPPEPKHAKPPPPAHTTVSQTNSCGNGAAPYCCNTDNFGAYTTCKVLQGGEECSATTVCCNANNSIQICLGKGKIV